MGDSTKPSQRATVVLVPGFFAFDRFANIPYFAGVDRLLPSIFSRYGVDIELKVATLPPTASVQMRAWALLSTLSTLDGPTQDPVYLVGHSSGGLDIRVALDAESPLALARSPNVQRVLARVQSVLTISTPHFGTPLATLATGLRAQQVLRMISWIFVRVFRHGRLPMGMMFQLGRWLAKIDEYVGLKGEVLDQLYRELLVMAPKDYFEELEQHFRRVGAHQGLIADLAPDICQLRNRHCKARPDLRFGCVVSRAPRPNLLRRPRLGTDPYAQLSHTVFTVLHRLAAKSDPAQLPVPTARDNRRLTESYGEPLTAQDNDAIVPSCSQLWGELVDAVCADHFDSMGYFAGREVDPMHVNWLASGSGFSALRFEQMWRRGVAFLLAKPELKLSPNLLSLSPLRASLPPCPSQ